MCQLGWQYENVPAHLVTETGSLFFPLSVFALPCECCAVLCVVKEEVISQISAATEQLPLTDHLMTVPVAMPCLAVTAVYSTAMSWTPLGKTRVQCILVHIQTSFWHIYPQNVFSFNFFSVMVKVVSIPFKLDPRCMNLNVQPHNWTLALHKDDWCSWEMKGWKVNSPSVRSTLKVLSHLKLEKYKRMWYLSLCVDLLIPFDSCLQSVTSSNAGCH